MQQQWVLWCSKKLIQNIEEECARLRAMFQELNKGSSFDVSNNLLVRSLLVAQGEEETIYQPQDDMEVDKMEASPPFYPKMMQ